MKFVSKFVSKFDFYQKFIFNQNQKSDNYIYIYIKLNKYIAKLFLLPKFNWAKFCNLSLNWYIWRR